MKLVEFAPISASVGACLLWLSACHTGGSSWTQEPLTSAAYSDESAGLPSASDAPLSLTDQHRRYVGEQYRVRTIGGELENEGGVVERRGLSEAKARRLEGRVLGTFRNTYYDFPSERDFDVPASRRVALKDTECKTISDVPQGFHDALCVQGSGRLSSGLTVSFAKRDCACAGVCPRTNQRICYEALRPEAFPWGRGATGRPITPLLTVAVDSSVIPLGTPIYIPEFEGAPRALEGNAKHDGCFIAQDRGVRVIGNHVDVFTGEPALTKLYNALVPSNQGVTMVLDSPRCGRVENLSVSPAQ